METELDQCVRLMTLIRSNPNMKEVFLSQFKTMFPEVMVAGSRIQEEGEAEGSDVFTRSEAREGRVDGYLQNTNSLNKSTNWGDPSSHPESSIEQMVTLHSRVADPTGSILVPELEVDELEVAHLLTRLGHERSETNTSPPDYYTQDPSLEFEPDLADAAPSRPRSSPKEREFTVRIIHEHFIYSLLGDP